MSAHRQEEAFIETLRREARKKIRHLGFPAPKSEEYRRVPITGALARHFSEADRDQSTPSSYDHIEPFLTGLPGERRIVFVNGAFVPSLSSLGAQQGLCIAPLREAAVSHRSLLEQHLGKQEDAQDPFALFNTAFWQDGVFVQVSPHTTVHGHLAIYYLHDARQAKVAAHTRLLVAVEQGGRLAMVEKTDSVGKHAVFNTLNEEIFIAENATLDYCKIQADAGLLHQVSNTHIYQRDGSQLTAHTLTLGGRLVRNNLNICIDGSGIESNLYGLYLAWQHTCISNRTVVDHQKPDSTSNELYKGIVGEQAQGIFNGKIYVRPHAQRTNAFQANRNVLVADTSAVHSKPQLEIWADDVKCSHGCTSGQLDEQTLFYLRSRGIAPLDARSILLQAFAQEVIDKIADEPLRRLGGALTSSRLRSSLGL